MSTNLNVNRVVALKKLKKALEIGKEVIDTAKSIAEDTSPLNITKEAFKHAHSYVEEKTFNDVYGTTTWKRWFSCPVELTNFIQQLAAEDNEPIVTKRSEVTGDNKLINIYGHFFKINDGSRIYKSQDTPDELAYELVGRLILEKVGFRCSYFSSDSVLGASRVSRHKFIPVEDERILDSPKAEELFARVKPFLDKRINRSVFLHGPPGTGKTCLVEYMASKVNGVYLSFEAEHLVSLSAQQIAFAIKVISPDILVINDIDRALGATTASILTVLESFNKEIKLLIVTSNSNHITPAAVRPGRFDEVIKITHLGDRAVRSILYGCSEEIIAQVKDWPAAFIRELKIRLDVVGMDNAPREIADLSARVASNNVY